MANILLVTASKSHSSIPAIADLLKSNHNVTIENISDLTSAEMMIYDLIVATRFQDDAASGNKLLECFNQGKPIMTTSIGGTTVGNTSVYDLSYLAGISSGVYVLTPSGRMTYSVGEFLGLEHSFKPALVRASSSFAYAIVPPFCNAAKVDCPVLDTTSETLPSTTSILTCEKGAINLHGDATPARYAFNGFLYGLGTPFSQPFKEATLKVVSWLLEPVGDAEIKGVTTLNNKPVSQRVVAVTNDINNPTVIGSTISDDLTGEYTISTLYNRPVMVFSMQDYGDPWENGKTLSGGNTIHPTTPNGYFYRVTQAGTTGNNEPNWPTTEGQTITDGGVVYSTELLLKPEIAGYKTPTPIS